MKTNNQTTRFRNRKSLLLLTVCAALAVTVAGFLQLSGLNGAVAAAQKDDAAGRASAAMISYALTHKVADTEAHYRIMNQLPCQEVADGLSGKTLTAGVYCVGAETLARELTLDAAGDASAVFIFRVAGAFKTADGAGISLQNGALGANVHIVADSIEVAAGSKLAGNLLTAKAITISDGATLSGSVRSASAEVNAAADAIAAPAAPGFLEICKSAAAGSTFAAGRTFTFTIQPAVGATQTVAVQVGSCSGPIAVEQGTAVITETGASGTTSNTTGGFQLVDVNTLTTTSNSTLGAVNFAARTATVNVAPGDIASELALEFVNQNAITGFIEICKEAATNAGVVDPDVSGFFTFNIEGVFSSNTAGGGATLQAFTAVPGECTGAIAVTIPTAGFPAFADVRVSEVGRDAGVALESIRAIGTNAPGLPAGEREVGQETLGSRVDENGAIVPSAGGGFTTIRVVAGDSTNEALVFFVNRSTPGIVKVCKIAGPGIPLNTPFTFTVEGTATTGPITRTVIVPAGPASIGGNCRFVGLATSPADSGTVTGPFQGFVIGTPVRVTETGARTILAADSTRPGEVFTSQITSSTGVFSSAPDLVRTDARISRASILARREVIVFGFTNFTFRPATLKVCKIAGSAALQGQAFSFTVAEVNAGIGLPARSTTLSVTAGPNNAQGGTCEIVSGAAFLNGALNANASYTVTEAAAAGTVIPAGGITCPTCDTATGQDVIFVGNSATRTGTLGTLTTIGLRTDVTINQVVFQNNSAPPGTARPFDFDGDGKADLSTFTGATGTWRILGSSAGLSSVQFGTSSDKLAPADYDGDRKTDVAVYRPSTGQWFIQRSTDGFYAIQFGEAGDIAQPGDFDGDGKADIALFRPSNGIWYILGTTRGFYGMQFGASEDRPVAGDYDGDGKTDAAVYRPSSGTWYVLGTTAGFSGTQFGAASDRAVPADYDGDGKTDFAVYRAGTWYLQRSTAGFASTQFGSAQDRALAADFNGDGRADLAVYRDGVWFIQESGELRSVSFGTAADAVVPASFLQ